MLLIIGTFVHENFMQLDVTTIEDSTRILKKISRLESKLVSIE